MDFCQRQVVWGSQQERAGLGYTVLARFVLFCFWEGNCSSFGEFLLRENLEKEGPQKNIWTGHTVSKLG